MQIDSKEFRFVAFFALGLVLVTSVPYLLGHALVYPASRFNENLAFDVDVNTYFAFMRQAESGQWLFHNPMTPEPHEPVFFNLEWLLAGKLAAFLGSLEAAFQCQRIAATFLLCFSFYWLTTFLFSPTGMRRFAFATVMSGGGFGWLLYVPQLGARLPRETFLDSYAGVHPFFWIFLQPHFLIAQSFALLTLCFFLRGESSGGRKDYAWAAVSCAVAGAMRPFDMLYLVAAIGLYVLADTLRNHRGASRRPSLARLLAVFASLPLFAYYVWLFKIHPVFSHWGGQNVDAPPYPLELLLSLGIVGILSVFGVGTLIRWRHQPPAKLLIGCCVVSSVGLLYSYPLLTFVRQLAPALLVPIALLGMVWLEPRLVRSFNGSWGARVGIAVFLLLNSMTSLLLFRFYLIEVTQGRHRTATEQIEAYEWLQDHSEPGDVVLASYRIANQIPRYTHSTVFSGYSYATVNYAEKTEMVRRFFQANTHDRYRKALVERFDVRYVLFARPDRRRTNYDPASTPFLLERYRNPVVRVFEVRRPTSQLGDPESPDGPLARARSRDPALPPSAE
jgi:hypothetical protein